MILYIFISRTEFLVDSFSTIDFCFGVTLFLKALDFGLIIAADFGDIGD